MTADAANPESPKVKVVSLFEANLIRILRSFLKQIPFEQTRPLLQNRMTLPNGLSANAIDLVKDSLRKGIILYLVRAGAWRKDRFLRDGQPKQGRLWERHSIPELSLSFSRHSLEFLIWVTGNKPNEGKPGWQPVLEELTIGDQLLFFLAYDVCRIDAEISRSLRLLPAFAQNALIWLHDPDTVTQATAQMLPDFTPWMTGLGSRILEALQPELKKRWLFIERNKGQIGDWATMLYQGRLQQQVLETFLQAADKAGRRDLGRFVIETIVQVLGTADLPPTFWIGGLQGSGPTRLAERLETQRLALSVIRQMQRFQQWERNARSSGYLDEDYAASKFYLSEWERWDGDRINHRAQRILDQLEPLRPTEEGR